MAYTFDIRPSDGRVHVHAQGPSGLEEVLQTMREVAEDPRHRPESGIVVDIRELDYVASFEDLLKVRDEFDARRAAFRGPIAVIVPDLLRYGITRTISGLAGMIGVRIDAFREPDDAEKWLAAESAPASGKSGTGRDAAAG